MKSFQKPEALKVGDTIALVRPCSKLENQDWQKAQKLLRSLGFCIVTYPYQFPKDSFFASNDESRTRELEWALKEPGIKGIFCARGGYGSARSLRDLKIPKRISPKLIMGYSDVTYLHHWVMNQLNWNSFHGPLVGTLDQGRMKKFLLEMAALSSRAIRIPLSEAKILQSGKSKPARLVGGNLSMLEVAGPASLPKEPILLILEDVNENFYRIDRMLGRLLDAGYDRYVQGIICGKFLNCGKDDKSTFSWKRIEESLKRLTNGPILQNVRFGHGIKNQRIFPLGVRARLSGKTLEVLEGAVRSP